MALKNNDAATKACWIGEAPTLLLKKLLMKKQGGEPTYLYPVIINCLFNL
jgi:hypothetical protein